jgi:hypothetical protein
MTAQIDDLSRACRGAVRAMIALAFSAAAALAASETANASALEINKAWSYGFDDSLWAGGDVRPQTLSPFAGGALGCFVNCDPAFGAYVVRRIELLSSNTADVSVNKTADPSGHAAGVSGVVITERLEPSSFDADPSSWTDWGVVAERVLDSNGTHSWALLSPDTSLDAHWLPIELYRFEGSSVSMDFVSRAPVGAGPAPEPSTWAMAVIGFAALGAAGYRSSLKSRRSLSLTGPRRRSSEVTGPPTSAALASRISWLAWM